MATTFYERLKQLCASSQKSVQFVATECGICFSSVEQWIRGDLPSSLDLERLCAYLHVPEKDLVDELEVTTIKQGETSAVRELGRQARWNVDAQSTLNLQYALLGTEPGKAAYIRACVDLILTRGNSSQKAGLLDSVQVICKEVLSQRLQF